MRIITKIRSYSTRKEFRRHQLPYRPRQRRFSRASTAYDKHLKVSSPGVIISTRVRFQRHPCAAAKPRRTTSASNSPERQFSVAASLRASIFSRTEHPKGRQTLSQTTKARNETRGPRLVSLALPKQRRPASQNTGRRSPGSRVYK